MQNKLNGYFCGWYFKLQSEDVTVALIPAFHRTRKGNFCTLQFISNDLVQVAEFPYEALKLRKRPLSIDIGGNTFSEKGIHLDVDKQGLSLKGEISFGPWSPLRGGDIMGPFAMVPFMQCRHGVLSTSHSADGWIDINGRRYSFAGARGYIEGDRGYSFPSVYLWTQCLFDDGSLMLSVADIPMGLFHFTGIIGFVHHRGKQWRIATYKGAKAIVIKDGGCIIRQGDIVFTAKLLKANAHPLLAPVEGSMIRTIRESASCTASYRLTIGGEVIFDLISDQASFEYEY